MAKALLVLLDAAVLALLSVMLFVSLLFQPDWVWLLSALIMLVGVVALPMLSRPASAYLLIGACPMSYTVWPLVLVGSLGEVAYDFLASRVALYLTGVVLLACHHRLLAAVPARHSVPR